MFWVVIITFSILLIFAHRLAKLDFEQVDCFDWGEIFLFLVEYFGPSFVVCIFILFLLMEVMIYPKKKSLRIREVSTYIKDLHVCQLCIKILGINIKSKFIRVIDRGEE